MNLNPVRRSDGILPEIASTHTEPYTNYILRLLFEASPDGFFVMMLDEPVMWDPSSEDPDLFDHIFQTQKITIFNTRSAELNPAFDGNLMGITPERFFNYDVANGRAAWKKLLKTGWLNMESSEEIAPGMSMWIETEFVNIHDDTGLLLGCFATQRDTTLKNAEVDNLTASSNELGSAIAAIGDPFIMADAKGVITYLNYAAEVTLDLTYDRLVNKKLVDLLQITDPESALDLKQILKQVEKNGIAHRLGNTAKLKFGINETAVTGVISSVVNDVGTHIGWILLLRYPGEVLKEIVEDTVNLERMKRLDRSLASGYWEIDLAKGSVWISDDIFELYGIERTLKDDPEELKFLQNKINDMIHPDDRQKVERAATDLIHDFKGYVVDYRMAGNDHHTTRYIRSAVEVHADESGTPVLISGVATDLTWYYNYLTTSSFFEQIIENAPLGILVTDPSGIIQYVNGKLSEMTGYSPAEMLGQKPSLFKSGVLPPVFYENIWKIILSGDIWQGDIINKKKDGTHYWDSGAISAIKGKDGDIERLVAFKQDVTSRKKLESEVKKQRDKLDRLHKEKISLLEDINLEIRNPLNGISGFLDLLISEVTDYEHRKILRSIKHSAGRVLNKLDSVSDILNMEKDDWNINLKKIEPGIALKEVLEYYKEIAEDKGLRFETYIQEGLSLITDPVLISKATGNLINNAVKFTVQGTVRVEVVQPPSNGDEIFIRVTDTGPGIKRDEIDAIFSDSSAAQELPRTVEATGFGLRVTKEILKKLGGTIKIESVPGKRTSFTIVLSPEVSTLPVDDDEERLRHFKKNSQTALRQEVLIVDDSKMNSDVMALYLRKFCGVDTARNGEQALRLAESKRYSAVILDINLGEGLSGVETMKKIKLLPGYDDVPFVAVTGYALNADKAKIVEEGFDFFYPKPVDMTLFTTFVRDLVVPEENG